MVLEFWQGYDVMTSLHWSVVVTASKRSTVRIEEDLMSAVRERAAAEHVSINRMINRLLRRGLESAAGKEQPFKEKVYSMGKPRFDLTKALALADALADEEFIRKQKNER